MRGQWLKVALVGVPVLVTVLALVGQLLIESEAQKFQAELDACIEREDESERCRTLRCYAQAGTDQARADCIASSGSSETSTVSTSSTP